MGAFVLFLLWLSRNFPQNNIELSIFKKPAFKPEIVGNELYKKDPSPERNMRQFVQPGSRFISTVQHLFRNIDTTDLWGNNVPQTVERADANILEQHLIGPKKSIHEQHKIARKSVPMGILWWHLRRFHVAAFPG